MSLYSQSDTLFAPKKAEQLKEPEEFRVVLCNDHYTTMDFVVEVLITVFHKDQAEANRIMWEVHRKGRGIVGHYSWDIAQTKAQKVHSLAAQYEFPLRCLVEPL
ncbi:MAG: ATP-dependent Clp protease adaptor ClpS [Spirochaetaceae bacterium]|jgi:ATP-dependent Clp protease adaptor protein ClpS|nr:ATP-dependent Clp protease adaptor ClpS [Spirochaetaceae bacterium]